jgi:solute:Na+ symporter, SSS family
MGLIWLTVLNIGLGILLAFVLFGKKTREIGQRLSAVTFPDLMCKLYKSPLLQYIAGFIIVISMPLYTAAILIGGARFIEPTLGISYSTSLILFALITAVYVVFGGLIAVMYTDAFQGTIMLIGMTVLLALTLVAVGGFTAGTTALTNMASLVPKALADQGMTGWTSMPVLGSPIWFTLVTTIVLGVGIGVLAQPQLVVRFMTAKDNKSLNRAILIGGPFILMMTGVAFTVGALSNVYFYQASGKIAMMQLAEMSMPSCHSSSTGQCRTYLLSFSCSPCLRLQCQHSVRSTTRWARHSSAISGDGVKSVHSPCGLTSMASC